MTVLPRPLPLDRIHPVEAMRHRLVMRRSAHEEGHRVRELQRTVERFFSGR